jgi:isoleucyl-tRNA synthetase
VSAAGFESLPEELLAQIGEELNVAELAALDGSDSELVTYTVRPNFRELGRRYGSGTQPVAAAIAAAEPAGLAAALRATGTASVEVDGAAVPLGPDDVIITQTPRSGWTVASASADTVALSVTITPELRREGVARDFIRLVQEARKADGLELTDRIILRWSTADPELAAALTEHAPLIAAEVLAADFAQLRPGAADAGGLRHAGGGLPLEFWLQKQPPGAIAEP